MSASLIITLRETLEAALIVGIVISFLKHSNLARYYTMVWSGVGVGIAISVALAVLFQKVAGGFSGRTEEIFEGSAMITGGILVTTLIVWMMRRKNVTQQLKDRVATHASNAHPWGIFFVICIAVLREGVETVIFLQSASLAAEQNTLLGALAGIVIAIVLGILIYIGTLRMNLKRFFSITGIILILFSAGLFGHGVHELQEASVLPTFIKEVWDINPVVVSDGVYPLLHENGHLGSFLKGLFGYNGNPSLLEIIIYLLYIGVSISIWHWLNKPVKAH